jgi:quinol monooxygenase YgiN
MRFDCGMVRLSVGLNASSSRCAQELLDAFRFVAVGTRLEHGCLGVSAWSDPDWALHYIEEWETESDLRRRIQSDRFTSLLSIVESARDPQIQFDFVSTTRGLDYVAEVRGHV